MDPSPAKRLRLRALGIAHVREVRAAGDDHELRAGNAIGQRDRLLQRGCPVVGTVDHQRRGAHAAQQIADVELRTRRRTVSG